MYLLNLPALENGYVGGRFQWQVGGWEEEFHGGMWHCSILGRLQLQSFFPHFEQPCNLVEYSETG